jgi:hypothetical protein
MGESTSNPRRVTPDEFLELRNTQFAARLSGVSLVAEVEVKQEWTDQALQVLGSTLAVVRGSESKSARLLRRWPALHVMAMAGTAIGHYSAGSYWDPLWRLAGLQGSPALQKLWGNAFLGNLERLGLPTFADDDDAGQRFVGRILMHAGIPDYCLADYMSLVLDRRRVTPSASAADVVAWAARQFANRKLYNIDVPVGRFLSYGGDYAVDLVDRTFDLLDVVSSGGDGAEVSLPSRFRDSVLRMRDDGQLAKLRGRSTRRSETGQALQPYLSVDPYGRGILLRLPAVSDAPEGLVTWLVTVDGSTERVPSQAMWPGSFEPAPETEYAVLRPARSATVGLLGTQADLHALPLVDEADPVLIFGEDLRRLPNQLPLPSAPVWLLYPEGAVAFGEGARVVGQGVLPNGWTGWLLELVDLSEADDFVVSTAGGSHRHVVRKVTAARVVVGDPVVGARTVYGTAVHSTLPELSLPPLPSEGSPWEVTITDGSDKPLKRLAAHVTITPEELWEGVTRPLLGSYGLRVRGPWGRGAHRRVVVAEGLTVESSPPWRRFQRQGLVPAQVRIKTAPGMSTTTPVLDLDPARPSAMIELSVHGETEPITITPPHMTVSHQLPAGTTAPSVAPVQLMAEDLLEDPGALLVDIGEAAEPRLRVLVGTAIQQLVEPAVRARHGVYRFDLASISDTLRAHPSASLSLDDAGHVTVALCRPRLLYSGISYEEGRLELVDCPDIADLMATVYLIRAPWIAAMHLPIEQGTCSLPASHVDAGPLLVSVAIHDPWTALPTPSWPATRTAKRIDAPGWYSPADRVEAATSRYLAEGGSLPREARPELLWRILQRGRGLELAERRESTLRECTDQLIEQRVDALLALSTLDVTQDEAVQLLVTGGLAWQTVTKVEEETISRLWTTSPAIAAIAGTLSGAMERNADVVEQVELVCGDNLARILGHGPDPAAATPRFDAFSEHYKAQDRVAREVLKGAAAFVPKALLDVDSRAVTAMALLARDRAPQFEEIARKGDRAVNEVASLLASAHSEAMHAVKARLNPDGKGGWRHLPVLSLGLAMVARCAARGDYQSAVWIRQQQSLWADLAVIAPEMVALDLVLAEVTLSGVESRAGSAA